MHVGCRYLLLLSSHLVRTKCLDNLSELYTTPIAEDLQSFQQVLSRMWYARKRMFIH